MGCKNKAVGEPHNMRTPGGAMLFDEAGDEHLIGVLGARRA